MKYCDLERFVSEEAKRLAADCVDIEGHLDNDKLTKNKEYLNALKAKLIIENVERIAVDKLKYAALEITNELGLAIELLKDNMPGTYNNIKFLNKLNYDRAALYRAVEEFEIISEVSMR